MLMFFLYLRHRTLTHRPSSQAALSTLFRHYDQRVVVASSYHEGLRKNQSDDWERKNRRSLSTKSCSKQFSRIWGAVVVEYSPFLPPSTSALLSLMSTGSMKHRRVTQLMQKLRRHSLSTMASTTSLPLVSSISPPTSSLKPTSPNVGSVVAATTPSRTVQFDTHKVVQHLKNNGFNDNEASAILHVMSVAMEESLIIQQRVLATREDHVQLKAELSEKVFNSTLKFDIAQRHTRDILERDFNNLKQEIQFVEKQDFSLVREEINQLEKRFLLQKRQEETMLNGLQVDIEKVEKRVLQYAVAFAGTIMAVGAGFLRLFT